MELDKEIKDYIIRYYGHLLAKKEPLFYHKLLVDKKATLNPITDIETIKRLDFVIKHKKAGLEDYVFTDVAAYLLEKYPEDIFLNYCPKCGKLARTPYAQQCPHCFYSWHTTQTNKP